MSNADAKTFWNKQTSSRHRTDDPLFYANKAEEHASLMTTDERAAGCVDLGCGAGELLRHFKDHVRVLTGIDYAQSMLDEAAKTLAGANIDLLNADVFEHLPNSAYQIWTTTGALNQYLDEIQINAFLDMFAANDTSRSLFLFDCVDPVRYAMMANGISYRPAGIRNVSLSRRLYAPVRRFLLGVRLTLGLMEKPFQPLRRVGMGYGQLPRFWHDAAARRNLQIEIVSSRYYEYRYHVALRKDSA